MVVQIQRQQDGSYRLRAEARAQMRNRQGTTTVTMEQDFVGQVQQGKLVFRGTRKAMTVNGRKIQSRLDQGMAQIVGGKLQGRSGNDQDGYIGWRARERRARSFLKVANMASPPFLLGVN